MIKRQFYKQEHNDGDGASDSSSSSSDSELEPEVAEETEAEDNDASEVKKYNEPRSSSSGYESEDSSINEVNADSSGSLTNDDESGTGKDNKLATKRHLTSKTDAEIEPSNKVAGGILADHPGVNCVLRSKSVFKCRLCPRIVCLSEETMKVHLKSKRHSRSAKLLSEGRLKLMLNSDGEIEGGDDGETHAERHARTVAAAELQQNQNNLIKKNKGRQRQRKRLSKKEVKSPKLEEGKQSRRSPPKKRRKSVK